MCFVKVIGETRIVSSVVSFEFDNGDSRNEAKVVEDKVFTNLLTEKSRTIHCLDSV